MGPSKELLRERRQEKRLEEELKKQEEEERRKRVADFSISDKVEVSQDFEKNAKDHDERMFKRLMKKNQ